MDYITLGAIQKQKGQADGIATLNQFGLHMPREMPAWFGVFPRGGGNCWSVPYGTPTTMSMTYGVIYAHPIVLMRDRAIDRIAIYVETPGGDGAVIRLGVYRENDRDTGTQNNQPTVSRVLDAGVVDATTPGVKEIEVSLEMIAGVYWLASVAQEGVNPQPIVRAITGFNPMIFGRNFNTSGVAGMRSVTAGWTSGELPDNNIGANWPRLANNWHTIPLVGVRFA